MFDDKFVYVNNYCVLRSVVIKIYSDFETTDRISFPKTEVNVVVSFHITYAKLREVANIHLFINTRLLFVLNFPPQNNVIGFPIFFQSSRCGVRFWSHCASVCDTGVVDVPDVPIIVDTRRTCMLRFINCDIGVKTNERVMVLCGCFFFFFLCFFFSVFFFDGA